MKILDLVLMGKWYDMIESGEKQEEYRQDKPYWRRRLLKCYGWIDWCKDAVQCDRCSIFRRSPWKDYTHVRFRRGYTRRTLLFRLNGFAYGNGNPEWGAPAERDVFIIKFGERV